MNNKPEKIKRNNSTDIKVGFLCYDLSVASRSTLNRLARFVNKQIEIVAFPLLQSKINDELFFSQRIFKNPGVFISFNNLKGNAPEIMWFGLPIFTIKSLVETSDVVCLLGIQGFSALLAALYAKIKNKPVLVITQMMGPTAELNRNPLIRLAKKWILNNSFINIAQTPPTADTLKKIYKIEECRIAFALWDGAAQEFQPYNDRNKNRSKKKLREELEIEELDYVIIFCGTLIYLKGVDILIRSFYSLLNKVPGSRLIIIGADGNPAGTEKILKRMVTDIGIQERVSFLGSLDWNTLSKFYLASDVFVLPTRKDIWPKVIIEAALAELPIITTDVCGAAHYLVKNDINGFIFPVEDENQLTESLCNLSNENLRLTMGKESRKLAEEYIEMSSKEASIISNSIHWVFQKSSNSLSSEK